MSCLPGRIFHEELNGSKILGTGDEHQSYWVSVFSLNAVVSTRSLTYIKLEKNIPHEK
jgi:hypothetical protein